jgi:transcriptional antiterminator RfaH
MYSAFSPRNEQSRMISEVQPLSSPSLAISTTFSEALPASWYVLRTKPRQEARAQDNLKAWGLETLLPLLPDRRKNRRNCDGIRALFPSYIFCRFQARMFDKVRFTYGVAHILSFGGKPAVVDEEIVDEIRAHMNALGVIDDAPPPAPDLQAGDKVLLTSGPFRNLVGVFQKEMPGSERVRILLETVSFRANVECLRSEVTKVD